MSKPSRGEHFEDAFLAMSAATLSARLDISETTLMALVEEGSIPKPFPIPGHPRLLRWDPEDVKTIVREWKELANPGTGKGFGDVR